MQRILDIATGRSPSSEDRGADAGGWLENLGPLLERFGWLCGEEDLLFRLVGVLGFFFFGDNPGEAGGRLLFFEKEVRLTKNLRRLSGFFFAQALP